MALRKNAKRAPAAAEASPGRTAADKIAGVLALIATKDMDTHIKNMVSAFGTRLDKIKGAGMSEHHVRLIISGDRVVAVKAPEKSPIEPSAAQEVTDPTALDNPNNQRSETSAEMKSRSH
jgi:hypothetical protein